MIKLGKIVDIQTGLVLSRKQAKNDKETVEIYRQLNLKAIKNDGFIDRNLLEEFKANERLCEDYITRVGDIVVRLTTPYTAVLVHENNVGIVVPSHFIIIRTKSDKILPEYLFWLLNADKVKSKIVKNMSSTMIGAVKPSVYAALEIEEMSLEEQRKIADVYSLAKREIHLYEQLIDQKEQFYKEAIRIIQDNFLEKRSK